MRVTDAMRKPRVGSSPPWLVGLFAGQPLVASLATSFRVNGARIRDELGWNPVFTSFRADAPAVVAVLAGLG